MSTAAPEEVQAPQPVNDLTVFCEEIDRVLALPKSVQDSIRGDIMRLAERARIEFHGDDPTDAIARKLGDWRYDLGVELDRLKAAIDDSPEPEDPTTLDASDDAEAKAARDAEKLADLQAKWRERFAEKERELSDVSMEVVRLKEAAAELEKHRIVIVRDLASMKAKGQPTELPGPKQREMFDDDEDDEEPAQGVIEMGADSDEDERYRPIPLARIGIPKGALARLKDAGITTIGDIEDHASPLDEIDGIGPKGEAEINRALDAFWAEWNADPSVAVAKYGN